MTVTPIQDFVSSVISRQSALTSAPAAAATVSSDTPSTTVNQSAAIVAASTQTSEAANLRNASVSFSQLSSLLQVTQGGTSQAESILQSIQSLAQQAASDEPSTSLDVLNGQFQTLLSQLDQIATGTSFGGSKLLNGSLSQSSTSLSGDSQESSLSLPDVSAAGLFGTNSPNLLSASSAATVLSAAQNASDTLSATNTAINEAQGQVSVAAASVETVQANAAAASSVLSESDLQGDGEDAFSALFASADQTSQAQTNNLSPSLLNLLQG